MWLMALFTFREAWRKKVALIAGALTLAFLALYGTGLHFITRDMVNTANPAATATSYFAMMQSITLFVMGIYLASFLVAGLAILAAVGSIAGEIENGSLYTLAVRPLSRRDLLLGKFLGLAAMLVSYATLFSWPWPAWCTGRQAWSSPGWCRPWASLSWNPLSSWP